MDFLVELAACLSSCQNAGIVSVSAAFTLGIIIRHLERKKMKKEHKNEMDNLKNFQ